MITLSDESNVTIFFCFYLIIFIVTVNFYRILKGKGKIEELFAFPCVTYLVWFHFLALFLLIGNLVLLAVLRFFFDVTAHAILYSPIVVCLLYHDTMADWMVPLILILAITLSYDLPDVYFHFRYITMPRDTLIWITMLTYGCLFNSFNPWDIVTSRRIHHENGHISTSFNVVDAFLIALSFVFIGLHGYRMTWPLAIRDNRFHITVLFIMIKTVFLIISACLLPNVPDHDVNSSNSADRPYSLDNLKMYESVIQSAVPIHYLAWKHVFFKNV